MIYISAEDFFRQVKTLPRLTREEERECALRMAQGDIDARRRLIEGYLPQVAAQIRRSTPSIQTLHTVYAAIATLEQGVDTFNFLQDSETFTHHLSWRMRQCLTRCIADHP